MYHETINGIWTGTVHGGYGLTGCTDGSASATTAAAEAQTGQAEDKAQEGAAAGTSEASGKSGEEGRRLQAALTSWY